MQTQIRHTYGHTHKHRQREVVKLADRYVLSALFAFKLNYGATAVKLMDVMGWTRGQGLGRAPSLYCVLAQ